MLKFTNINEIFIQHFSASVQISFIYPRLIGTKPFEFTTWATTRKAEKYPIIFIELFVALSSNSLPRITLLHSALFYEKSMAKSTIILQRTAKFYNISNQP